MNNHNHNHTVKWTWGRDISNGTRTAHGALDTVVTVPNGADPNHTEERIIDIVYHNTDVGVKYYRTDTISLFMEAMHLAEEFCTGYNEALKDLKRQ